MYYRHKLAGGGKANRIKMKSVGLGELIPLFEIQDCIFVSLQYGDDGPNIKKLIRMRVQA